MGVLHRQLVLEEAEFRTEPLSLSSFLEQLKHHDWFSSN
ncbi:hypothetical protein BFV94_4963, partial [Alteromonas macleodii]